MIPANAELDTILSHCDAAELFKRIFAPYRHLLEELRSIYVFGAGSTGRTLARRLQEKGITVLAFLDNQRQGEMIEGLPCLKPEQADSTAPHAIATGFQQEIAEQLRALGRVDFIPYPVLTLWYRLPRELCLSDIEDIGNYREKYSLIHNRLADDLSRQTFLAIFQYRTTLDPVHLARMALPADLQYFGPAILDISKVKTFVDAGGYDGETTRSFIRHSDGNYDRVFYIEPDPVLFDKSHKRLEQEKRINFVNKALSNEAGTASFASSGDMQGGLIGSGCDDVNGNSVSVECIALDSAVSGQVDLLKLDIEGAECDALQGSARILQGKPILAIAYDHSCRDLWRVIETIDLLSPGYRYYIRHYGTTVTETVLYAVPTG